MKTKRIFLLIAMVTLVNVMMAREELQWTSKTYDFGTIKEEEGPVTGNVKFVNTGKKATYINRVRPSCGCTGASYTTSMIEPGDTATITFTYNPMGRPGIIDKTVKVYTGEENDMAVIHLTGMVMASPETLESRYPEACGPLRLENKILPIGELVRGVSRHAFLNVYNNGDRPIKPTWKTDEKALKVSLVPEELAPGETGTFSFKLSTDKMDKEGRIEVPVEIRAGKNASESVIVTLNGVIVSDKPKVEFGK